MMVEALGQKSNLGHLFYYKGIMHTKNPFGENTNENLLSPMNDMPWSQSRKLMHTKRSLLNPELQKGTLKRVFNFSDVRFHQN